tara:strand:- start:115 stop:642 length:528 start_codon:yes stop_codon:yes gene_type:complete
MNYISKVINLIAILLFMITPFKYYKPNSWLYKSLLIHLGTFLSLNTCNKIIGYWIIPLIIYLNIFILLIIQYSLDKSNWFSFIIILFLLFTFKFKNFRTRCGRLINPDKEWIFVSIFLLIIWYSLLNEKYVLYTSKIILIILVLYPLYFPIEDYFIHRGVTLSILSSLSWYFLAM